VDVLFNRLRRDDTTMEPQFDAPALMITAVRAGARAQIARRRRLLHRMK